MKKIEDKGKIIYVQTDIIKKKKIRNLRRSI